MTDRPRQRTLFDPPEVPAAKADGPPCLACGGATVISPGTPPHHARIDCTRCRAWRWLPRPKGTVRG